MYICKFWSVCIYTWMSQGPFRTFLWVRLTIWTYVKCPFLWLKACSPDDTDGSGNSWTGNSLRAWLSGLLFWWSAQFHVGVFGNSRVSTIEITLTKEESFFLESGRPKLSSLRGEATQIQFYQLSQPPEAWRWPWGRSSASLHPSLPVHGDNVWVDRRTTDLQTTCFVLY